MTVNVDARVMTVTPAMAKEWLEYNKNNRNIRRALVDRLARDMAAGRWVFTGEPIKRNGTGALLDGQHRLHAVVQADTPILTLVVDGVASEAQIAMDTGSKRKFSDVLQFQGEANAATLAAAIGYYWRIINDRMRSNTSPSNHEAIALLAEHPGLRDSIAVASRCYSAIRLSPGIATALHYAFSQVDAEEADFFFEHLTSGATLAEGSPILHLRKRLLDDVVEQKKMQRPLVTALIIKAWNAFIEGREIRSLRWRTGGASPETFPEISEGSE